MNVYIVKKDSPQGIFFIMRLRNKAPEFYLWGARIATDSDR